MNPLPRALILLILLGLLASAACSGLSRGDGGAGGTGGGAGGGGGDASSADRAAPFVGVWRVGGTVTTTCTSTGTQVTQLGATVSIARGTGSDLVVTLDCPFLFDIPAAGQAVIRPDQPCMVQAPPATISYDSWTIQTADGLTGAWSASGVESIMAAFGIETCAFDSEASLSR